MWEIPRIAITTCGVGAGSSRLSAFDAALRNADIGNLNLIKVSSILPPHIVISTSRTDLLQLHPGMLAPTVYTSIHSAEMGQIIASSVVLAIPSDPNSAGVIFEASLIGNANLARVQATEMAVEALKARGTELGQLIDTSCEYVVNDKMSVAACVAAVVFLP